jgi:hypothetical protein
VLSATTILAGKSFTDQATLTGASTAPPPSGTVTYKIYPLNDTSCSGTPTTSPVTLTSSGSVPASSSFTTSTTPGTYNVIATYSGDTFNVGISSPCASEQVTTFSDGTLVSKTIKATFTYSYTETNNGTGAASALSGAGVADNGCTNGGGTVTQVLGDGTTTADSSHNKGDLNNNNLLDPGETWQFKCTVTVGPIVLTSTGGGGLSGGPFPGCTSTSTSVSCSSTATGTGTDQIGNTVTSCPPGSGSTTVCIPAEQTGLSVSISKQ